MKFEELDLMSWTALLAFISSDRDSAIILLQR